MKRTVEMNYTNTYLLGYGACSVSVTQDVIASGNPKWGIVISRLDKLMPIGKHIKTSAKTKEFDPTIILSEGKDGIRVLMRAAMKAYMEMGGDDPMEVWEDSKRFYAKAAEIEK